MPLGGHLSLDWTTGRVVFNAIEVEVVVKPLIAIRLGEYSLLTQLLMFLVKKIL